MWDFSWPGAYQLVDGKPAPLVQREAPVVAKTTPYALTYRLDFLAAAGTLVLIATFIAFIPMVMSGAGTSILGVAFGKTVAQLRLPIVTIAFILSIATVMNYSGMTSSMALALAATGWLFPFFSAWLGMLGVFLTGSDTSSNTLFGPLQATTAKVSGLDPILMGATNSSAGVMGKMISPQNLSVGAAGVGAVGREGEIFRQGHLPQPAPHRADGAAGDAAGVRRAVDGAEAVRFGDFVFDSGARLLARSGEPVHLTAKAVDLLSLLSAKAPDAVSKKAIHQQLWPDTFVSDVSLTTLVFELRAALGESARKPRFVRTVHGFGYAFQGDNAQNAAVEEETPFVIVYEGREFGLQRGENLLGRSRDCRVRVDSTGVSRRHARITIDGDAALIEDCGSRNGTWVGGNRTSGRVRLRDGDDIGIAGIPMRFRILLEGAGRRLGRIGLRARRGLVADEAARLVRAVAERLLLGLSAAAQRKRLLRHHVLGAGPVDQLHVLAFDEERAILPNLDRHAHCG